MMDIVSSYMEFAALRRKITKDWYGFTKRKGYSAALACLLEMERSNIGGYVPESGISHAEFYSPHAFFTLSSRELLDVTIKTSTRLVGSTSNEFLDQAKEILKRRSIDSAIYLHEMWVKPHFVIIVDLD